MGIKIGFCGVGSFADSFIPLFKAHPRVTKLILCDLDAAKLRQKAEKFDLPETCPSLDNLCQTDVDAIAIFSQNWLHGPQAVQALNSGKHVYSAVPSAITPEEMTGIIDAVSESCKIYMLGETSYYTAKALYCRQRFQNGDFGEIVFGEGQYYHDFDHGLYDVMKWRGGKDWRKYAGSPPMHYPTHSTSMIVSVTGAHATQVSCLGWEDHHEDGIYRADSNIWQNTFSNESALFRMSDGSICRINEFRRIGHPGTEGVCLYGTKACYQEQPNGSVWATKNRNEMLELNEDLKCAGIPAEQIWGEFKGTEASFIGVSKIHPVKRLPKEFVGLPNGHQGSHQFLVDDFVNACADGELPPNHVWQAARYVIPGLVAHQSALENGKSLPVPDYGDPPANFKVRR
ncbi:Gfo/Idh/MocA family oxidoreductase [candidate division KSB1 bacterium]|nr:Gfo/Idh/MocA family oxidoreductase [candidate division KSB1 bacterium]